MHLLVIRTSAMGDVALTTPVLRSFTHQYPGSTITLVTRKSFSPFFEQMEGLELFFPDFRERHSGFTGIIRLFLDLRKGKRFNHVIDLHDVLRSKVLRLLFRISGISVSVINKGRKEKRDIINGRIKTRLRHSVERYCSTFVSAGFPVTIDKGPWLIPASEAEGRVKNELSPNGVLNIGVAPYAKHDLKRWPEEQMIRLLEMIKEKRQVNFWLFGGYEESDLLDKFCSRVPCSRKVPGLFDLGEEIALISRLDLMIAMDSSNMHMAALAGAKVISIWGGTDPITGFGAWQQPDEYSIRIPVEELTCRPCTVYGKGNCRRGDFACMMWLTPEMVFERIAEFGLLNASPFKEPVPLRRED